MEDHGAESGVGKVKLRLHFNGAFQHVSARDLDGEPLRSAAPSFAPSGLLRLRSLAPCSQDADAWRYAGGEVYNESVPITHKYADVVKKFNDKFGDTVGAMGPLGWA